MALLWYGHFDCAPDDERTVTAAEWARYIASFITNGVRNGGTNLQVTAHNRMVVKVDTGMANINGYIVMLDEDYQGRYYEVLVPDAHPQFDRIDRLVLRLDTRQDVRKITPVIAVGTAASNPSPPLLQREGYIYELSLARIRVRANAVAIVQGDITDERFDSNACGLINSILGLDPSVWQQQFDDFMASLRANGHNSLNALMAAMQAAWDGWFAQIRMDPTRYISFNFDNLEDFPGCKKRTTFPGGNMLTEWRVIATGTLVAKREMIFSTMTRTTVLYGADGVTELKRRVVKTTFPVGAMESEVIG